MFGNNWLDGGEVWIYTGSRVITGADPDPFVNTVSVTGEDGDGNELTATDQHSVDVVPSADLSLTKTASPTTVELGDAVVGELCGVGCAVEGQDAMVVE